MYFFSYTLRSKSLIFLMLQGDAQTNFHVNSRKKFQHKFSSVQQQDARGPAGYFPPPNHLSNKIVSSPKIFTNTYRMELNLCQLNSVNVLLHIT